MRIRKIAIIAIIGILLTALPVFAAAPVKTFKLHILDVGQGDCMLLEFPGGKTMMVDAGDGRSHNDSHIDRYIKRYFKNREPVIDVFVATHPHADHIGGAADIIRNYKVGVVWDSGYNNSSATQKKYLKAIRDKKVKYHKATAGEYTNIGGAVIRVLGPVKAGKNANNNSIVMHITYGNTTFLLPGDMEKAERQSMVSIPHADVYKAAHHGSHTGTDTALLSMVSPKYIIYSYKTGNSYGHPHTKVVNMVEQMGIKRLDTPNGDIVIESNGADIKVTQAKEML